MLAPFKLLKLAEDLAGRIPLDPAYQEERNVSWALIGEGWLPMGAVQGAQRALNRLSDPRYQAELRLEICCWLRKNTGEEAGRAILRDTIENLAYWEEWFSRTDIANLVAVTHREFGESPVREMAGRLSDPFAKSNVLVLLSYHQESETRLDTLREAERLAANSIRDCDRDFALRWVLDGYEAAGQPEDAARVRSRMGMTPQQMDAPLQQAEELLDKVDLLLKREEPDPPPDRPFDQALRLLDYQINDLKVRFLVNLAHAGGVVDHDLENLVSSDRFLRVEPPRQPGIQNAPPLDTEEQFARFFFARPVAAGDRDKQLLDGDPHAVEIKDPAKFVGFAARLFRNFGEIAPRYSMQQVEQGLWYLLGHAFSLGDFLFSCKLPLDLQEECVRAMLCPFRDYYARVSQDFEGTFFYMWWDILLTAVGDWDATEEDRGERRSRIECFVIETLKQILGLPSKDCQLAALHGLNHLHSNPLASGVVSQYLDENRDRLTADEIEWAKACRDGQAG
jgi:hypothetical protein